MKLSLLFFLTLFFLAVGVNAQNTSPYWSLAGNTNTTNSSILGTLNGANLNIYTNGTRKMIITPSGLVGIGTGSPLTKFHVNGFGSFGNRVTSSNAIRAINLADDNAVLRVLRVDASNAPAVELISRTSADGANVAYWDFYAQPSDASFRIRDRKLGGSGLDRVTISSGGNVGIGTTFPLFSLDVRSVAAYGQFKSSAGHAGVIIDKSADDESGYVIHKSAGTTLWTEGTFGNNNFSLHNWSLGSDALTIDNTNNYVGIGTTTPSAQLHVVGGTSGGTAIYGIGYDYGVQGNVTNTYGTGVYGNSDQGYGVYGNSNYIGVYGYAGNGSYGTFGYSNSIGAYGSGTTYGTYGYNYSGTAGAYGYTYSGTAGVYGTGYNGEGVYGSSTNSYGGYFTSTNSYALVASSASSYYAGVFYGHVYSSDGFVTSDKNLKTNIHEFENAMSIINKLKPENYEFKKDEKYASLHLPTGSHYGLLAQDLEQVLPNLVSEAPHELKSPAKPIAAIKPTADGKPMPVIAETQGTKETTETIKIKAVNYVELIPIMVKAMQELSKENEDLKNQINDLKSLISKNSNGSITSLEGYLKQNIPNPSNNSTIISYYTPDNTRNAQILVTDMKGSVLKAYTILRGEGQVNISNGELPAGTYNYTLYVNSNKVDTKRMIMVK